MTRDEVIAAKVGDRVLIAARGMHAATVAGRVLTPGPNNSGTTMLTVRYFGPASQPYQTDFFLDELSVVK